MIRLGTTCTKCSHKEVCKHVGNADHAMNKLKGTIYGDGPSDDYDWETMMNDHNVTVTFSCPSFSLLRPVSRKVEEYLNSMSEEELYGDEI